MPDLASHQHEFARALRAIDRGGDGRKRDDGRADDASRHLFTTDAATSARRIAIYRANSIASATKALTGAYPVIREVVGGEFFDALVRAYWQSTPSHSGDLGDYGDAFDAFVAGFEPVGELPYLADLARLEWAVHLAESAADAPRFDAATLADVPPDRQSTLIFTFVPGTAIVSSAYPIARIWSLHRDDSLRSEAAESDRFDIDWNVAETALVVRNGFEVRVAALDLGSAAALRTMQSGATLIDALSAGLAASELSGIANQSFDAAGAPAAWLAGGLFAGFRFPDHAIPAMEKPDVNHR
ncbi:MAG: HvfC/BufC family peptide modification chaperone [Burkholderiaceae bacterium]